MALKAPLVYLDLLGMILDLRPNFRVERLETLFSESTLRLHRLAEIGHLIMHRAAHEARQLALDLVI